MPGHQGPPLAGADVLAKACEGGPSCLLTGRVAAATAAVGPGGGDSEKSAVSQLFHSSICRAYELVDPTQLLAKDSVLVRWAGREPTLFAAVCTNYRLRPVEVLDRMVVMKDLLVLVGRILARTGVLTTPWPDAHAQLEHQLGLPCGQIACSRMLKHLIGGVTAQFIIEAVAQGRGGWC